MPNLLLIDDDDAFSDLLRSELEALGHTVTWLDRAAQAPELLATGRFDLILLDNGLPGMSGIDFLKVLRDRGLSATVIVVTGDSTPDTAIRATKNGAFDYVVKSDTAQELAKELEPLIQKALEIIRPAPEVHFTPVAPAAPDAGPALVGGKNKRMLEVYKAVARLGDGELPIHIFGETGTGKELVARALHTYSPRKGKPFIALNCSAFVDTLFGSELFGHEKGAFTGADKLHKGKFEQCQGGTLFLDEIGDMPLNLQPQLLRVLQEQTFQRVGGNETIKADVRILSATHRDMDALIREGKFREDLFFRLKGDMIRLPPLRERPEDLPELVAYFLTRAAHSASRPQLGMTEEAMSVLRAYHWPGNVRELQHVIARAAGVCYGTRILPSHLELATKPKAGPAAPNGEAAAMAGLLRAVEWAWATNLPRAWPELRDRLESELLRYYLARLNQTDAARRLGMGRTKLSERLKKPGGKPEDESEDGSEDS